MAANGSVTESGTQTNAAVNLVAGTAGTTTLTEYGTVGTVTMNGNGAIAGTALVTTGISVNGSSNTLTGTISTGAGTTLNAPPLWPITPRLPAT